MNTDDGEIRQFKNAEELPEGWVKVTEAEAKILEDVPAEERMSALSDLRMTRQQKRAFLRAAKREGERLDPRRPGLNRQQRRHGNHE